MKKPKCKNTNCKIEFERIRPLQNVCSTKCAIEYSKQLKLKRWAKEKRTKLPELYPRKYKGYLQDEINKLARKIDSKLLHNTCMDCDKTLIGIKQVDGAHFTSVGSNPTIRYNLHNIHSARSDCNSYSDTHHEGYKEGIIKRYGKPYLNQIEGLKLKYKIIKLSNKEVAEKLAIVRKLNRDFDTFEIIDGVSARDLFNKKIGIYK